MTVPIQLPEGLITEARYLPSPHCDSRPPATVIDMVVIHGISLPPGQFGTGYIEKLFCNQLNINDHPYFATIPNTAVSAHLLITRQGELLQFVPFAKRAWHAGQSFFAGRTHCNDFSIGIELEGADELPYTAVQYTQLASVLSALCHVYPDITRERIVGHSDIAPGRKTDPGPMFDWKKLNSLLVTHSLTLSEK